MDICKVLTSLICLIILQPVHADQCADKIAEMERVDIEYNRDKDMRFMMGQELTIRIENMKITNFLNTSAGAGLVAASKIYLVPGPHSTAVAAVAASVAVTVAAQELRLHLLERELALMNSQGEANEVVRGVLAKRREQLRASNCGQNDDSGPTRDDEPEVQVVEPTGGGNSDDPGCVFCSLTEPLPDTDVSVDDGEANCETGSHWVWDGPHAGSCVPD